MSRHIEVIARGIWQQDRQVLLCQNTKRGHWYLPGGHVEYREPAAAALRRELLEELGINVRVGALAFACECIFKSGGRWHHEVNLVFHVEHPGNVGALEPREKGIRFRWVPRSSLRRVDIRPEPVKAWLMIDDPRRPWGSAIDG